MNFIKINIYPLLLFLLFFTFIPIPALASDPVRIGDFQVRIFTDFYGAEPFGCRRRGNHYYKNPAIAGS
jgi:hypothetical protein